jgi:putative membrane protein
MSESSLRWAIAFVTLAVNGLVAALVMRGSVAPGVIDTRLPAINATLNATSALLLIAGYRFIRRGRRSAHQACMLSALGVSALFLVTYVLHHYQAGSVRFVGPSWLKLVYLSILGPHIVLAAAIVPLALFTVSYAWRGELARHRRWARWTFPLWLYVSVSGVAVYFLLYHAGSAAG